MSTRKRVNASTRKDFHRSRAKLGQNFLTDAGAARRIVEALGDVERSIVVEIGPGRGALTRLLAERAKYLIAVELDEMLAQQLRVAYREKQNVEVVRADFLKFSLSDLLSKENRFQHFGKARVVGNIPYYITSDILLRLYEQHELIEIAVLMMQNEVADRVAAQPGSRDYGLLTVTTKLFANVESLFTLPPAAFSPPPQVHSTVLRLRMAPKAQSLGVDAKSFIQFCKLAFSQKRKTLFNNLRSKCEPDQIRSALNISGIRDDVRAEALSLEQLASIYRRVARKE